MNCPNCGFENSDTAKFCNECGSSLSDVSTEADKVVPDESKDEPIAATGDSVSDHDERDSTQEDSASSQDEDSSTEDELFSAKDKSFASKNKSKSSKEESSDKEEHSDKEESSDKEKPSSKEKVSSSKEETQSLDLPPIFNDDEEESEGVSSEFDFSDIDAVEVDNEETSSETSYDTRGLDEYLVDPNYVPPKPSWNSGDTVSMPKIEGEEAPKQKEFRAPDANKQKRPAQKIALIGVAVAVVIALVALGVTYQLEIWGGKSLPDVVGQNQTKATEILEDLGFNVKVMHVKSDDVEGLVLLMDPGSGRRLSEGSEVVLQVATPRIIPEILGKNLDDAIVSMEQENFDRVEYVSVKSDEPENTVIGVDPEPGSKVKASTLITVTIAEPYTVPDTIGQGVYKAYDLLKAEGYVVYESYIYSDTEEGIVLASDPAPGTKLAYGSTVTIQISKSRANELIGFTNSYLAEIGYRIDIAGTTYEIDSSNIDVIYAGDNKTVATVQATAIATLDGEVVRGTPKQRMITFAWNEDNSLNSYA